MRQFAVLTIELGNDILDFSNEYAAGKICGIIKRVSLLK